MADGERGGAHHGPESAMNDFEAKMICAEQLLVRVAAALRRLPFDESTKALHLRALALKPELRQLRESRRRDMALCDALLSELERMLAMLSGRDWS